MKPVEFIKNWLPYNIGQIAGFPPEFADKLISAGAAREYVAKAPTPTSSRPAPDRETTKMVKKDD